jgi:hypothetical protein
VSGIYLGLGGNLGAVARTFGTALEHFERSEWLRVVSSSRLWRSPAWGFEGPDFLNAVVEIQTDRSPQRLLAVACAQAGWAAAPSTSTCWLGPAWSLMSPACAYRIQGRRAGALCSSPCTT